MSQMEVLNGSMGIICLVRRTLLFGGVLFYIETNGIINVFNKEMAHFIYFDNLKMMLEITQALMH